MAYTPPYYPQYNPMPYGREQYPTQMPAQAPQTPTPPSGFICRPVTSREEAVAVQVDFLGPGTVMPDLGHGMIYLKRFNAQTGASDLLEFVYSPPREEAPTRYATVEDIDALRAEIEALKPKKAVKKNDDE